MSVEMRSAAEAFCPLSAAREERRPLTQRAKHSFWTNVIKLQPVQPPKAFEWLTRVGLTTISCYTLLGVITQYSRSPGLYT